MTRTDAGHRRRLDARKPPPGRGALGLCYGGMMVLALAMNLTPVYLTTFGETFGGASRLSEEQLGRIPAVMYISLVSGILVSGPLADRWGAKRFAMLGLLLACAGLVFLGMARNYAMLLTAGAILGFGAGILDMVLSPIVSILEPERRASALNWLHSFYCTGAVCTTLIGSAALYLHIPWRAVAISVAAFPAALLLGFAPLRVPPLVHENAEREPLRVLLAQPYFLAALAAILLAGAGEIGMAQWLPAYAELGLGYSKATGGLALTGFSMGMVAGRILAAIAGRKFRPVPLMITCCSGSVVLYLTGCFFPYAPVALLACAGVGFTGSCLWPTTLGVTADRFPDGGASMFALLAASGNAGCTIIPWIIGIVAGATNLHYGLATAALCPAIMILVLSWMGSHGIARKI